VRQFDFVDNPSERTRAVAPYLLVLQSHLLTLVESVVVAPIIRDARRPLAGVDVPVTVSEEAMTITLMELFSLERSLLKTVRGSLAQHEDEIRRGLDRLFTGF
jgi:toxin CcdB